jgi:D-galactarolactone cycloisomerase|tara:strand:- start:396 stop:1631 length:1236 start_codon:yes stop_codon:yes gene_type:complete
MKITNIEIIPIAPKLAPRYATRRVDLYGIDARVVYKVSTDAGLTGYGDTRVRPYAIPAKDSLDHLVGRSPFDFVNDNRGEGGSGLLCALYDLMGKHLDLPVHKLLGQKKRNAIPVAAWTRPCSPEIFRDEIQRAAEQGYRVYKIHTCAYHDVFEQTRLAEEVAPTSFRIHYDFNHNRSLGSALPIIKELEKNHPIVGYIEDPLHKQDIDGWRRLRQQTDLPLIMHGTPLGGIQELIYGLADMYMIGGSLEDTMAAGWACGKANVQVLLQFEGGTLGKAMAMHMASVLPTHTAHSINLDDQYAEDYTTATIPVVDGASPVPTGPGLGFDVDEDALARLAEQAIVEQPTHVGVLHMPGGQTYYGRSYISPTSITGHQEGVDRGFRSEIWEDDGSTEFAKIHDRVQKEGVFRAD